jgi:energy coupling factor transporter S component ThiW
MCGALLCGLVYQRTKKLLPTLLAEVFGTGVIGGLLAWPVVIFLMGKAAGDIAFYAYIVPFLISTVGGSILAGVLLFALQKAGALHQMQHTVGAEE